MHWVVSPLTIQLTLVVTGIAKLVVIGRRSISEMISAARQIVAGQPA